MYTHRTTLGKEVRVTKMLEPDAAIHLRAVHNKFDPEFQVFTWLTESLLMILVVTLQESGNPVVVRPARRLYAQCRQDL